MSKHTNKAAATDGGGWDDEERVWITTAGLVALRAALAEEELAREAATGVKRTAREWERLIVFLGGEPVEVLRLLDPPPPADAEEGGGR